MSPDESLRPTDPTPAQANITAYWSLHGPAYAAHPSSQFHMGAGKDAWTRVWQGALPPPPADLLDVGTGTGFVALLLAELGHRLTGIDLAEGMLTEARTSASALPNPPTFQLGDAVEPPFPPASFDAITNRYLLWTLREPARALENWHRLLRPGGRLALVDSNWYAGGLQRDTYGGTNPDRAEFLHLYDDAVIAALPLMEAETIEAMAALARDAGFRDVTVTPLVEMERLQRALSSDGGDDLRLQFLITAFKD